MSKFFLQNAAISVADFDAFKVGIFNLIEIKRVPSHVFFKHSSIYSLPIIVNNLFASLSGQEEQEIFKFIEQLTTCESLVDTETQANQYCSSEINAFLGIDFNGLGISSLKQITSDNSYKAFCLSTACNLEHFLDKTPIAPDKKKVHLSSHHGQKELNELCGRLRNSPYVLEMRSTNWGGKNFIREVHDDGTIEIVLPKSEREYALLVKTTGKNRNEATAIAKILQVKYDN